MFITAQEAADQCGISIEKLEKIARRRDCPKKMMDDEGNYNPIVVTKMLERLKKVAETSARYHKTGRTTKRTRKTLSSVPRQETLEEFQLRFWTTDKVWQEFCLNDVSEDWMRYFIRKALEFGHATAYPK